MGFNEFTFVSVLKCLFLRKFLRRVLTKHKWSRKQKQWSRSWMRLCWCPYMPVHTKIFIALKICSVFKARMLYIPTNNIRAVELCSRLHICCVLSVREHSNTKRRDLLSFLILCLCRCGWSYHHQHPDKPQQWTEAGYCLCLSEENQKGSKKWRNNNYLIFFLWIVRFSGLVHLTIYCEQMRSYYWAYLFTGSKDAFTLSKSVKDFLAVAEITIGDISAS